MIEGWIYIRLHGYQDERLVLTNDKPKGEIKLKAGLARRSKKASKTNSFVCLFFGRIYCAQICFWIICPFTYTAVSFQNLMLDAVAREILNINRKKCWVYPGIFSSPLKSSGFDISNLARDIICIIAKHICNWIPVNQIEHWTDFS